MGNKLNSESGFSVVDSVVASGLGVIVLLSLSASVNNLMKREKKIADEAATNELVLAVKSAIQYKLDCISALGGQPFSLDVPLEISYPKFSTETGVWLSENTSVGTLSINRLRWANITQVPGSWGGSSFYLAELEMGISSLNYSTKKKIELIVLAPTATTGAVISSCYRSSRPTNPVRKACYNIGGIYSSDPLVPCTIPTLSRVTQDAVIPPTLTDSEITALDPAVMASQICSKLGVVVNGACKLDADNLKFSFQTQYYTNPKNAANADTVADQAVADLMLDVFSQIATSP